MSVDPYLLNDYTSTVDIPKIYPQIYETEQYTDVAIWIANALGTLVGMGLSVVVARWFQYQIEREKLLGIESMFVS